MNDKKQKSVKTDDLNALIQLDIDASHSYTQAISNIPEEHVRKTLVAFKADHERHIDDLSTLVRRMGGEPVRYSKDIKGVFLEGFTRLRSMLGTEQALKAMRSNENLTNAAYERALSWDLTPEQRTVIERNRQDERRHLEYINRALVEKYWETPSRRTA